MSSITPSGLEVDEHQLIAAAKAGSQGAYAQLLGRHQAVAFRASAPFRPWLVRIAINEARNRRRGSGRQAGLAIRAGRDPAEGRMAASAESEALAAEERARLAAAVGRLREDDQLVIAAVTSSDSPKPRRRVRWACALGP